MLTGKCFSNAGVLFAEEKSLMAPMPAPQIVLARQTAGGADSGYELFLAAVADPSQYQSGAAAILAVSEAGELAPVQIEHRQRLLPHLAIARFRLRNDVVAALVDAVLERDRAHPDRHLVQGHGGHRRSVLVDPSHRGPARTAHAARHDHLF